MFLGDRWPEWVSGPNTFFINLLKNLGGITGRMPDVRVGADSEDRTTFDNSVNVCPFPSCPSLTVSTILTCPLPFHDQTVQANFPPSSTATPYPEAYSLLVSPSYYALSQNLPAGTHMIWGINFGSDNIDNAVNMASAIKDVFEEGSPTSMNGVVLDAIEIGNEADLYARHGNRSSGYDIEEYMTELRFLSFDFFLDLVLPMVRVR